MPNTPPRGRATRANPSNRFSQLISEPLDIDLSGEEVPRVETLFLRDRSRTILARNDSPDIDFTYSLNPYRGCEHGCIYCYARPSHEYLGFSSGLDFETRIMVKLDAPKLLDAALRRRRWVPQTVCLSGNTDCYQPVERKLALTRQCLAVFLAHRNPVGIITKNALVGRDIDILKQLAGLNLVRVLISMTSLDAELTRRMEPRTAVPQKRLETIELLASHGVSVGINLAPVIPGLNDEEIPAILRESSARGARYAAMSMVRLPGTVAKLFPEWIEREFPHRAKKVLSRMREIHGGSLDDQRWSKRFTGEGTPASTLWKMFEVARRKYNLDIRPDALTTTSFIRNPQQQQSLFDHQIKP